MTQTAAQIPADLLDVEPNERLKAIFASVVGKMKDVVREHRITQDELHVAGDYFNRLGQSGFSRSLIDVALAMTSVDATALVEGGTRPNLEGPFHRASAPVREDGNLFHGQPNEGTPVLYLSGRVTDAATGEPLTDAHVDLWQADHQGHYDLETFNLYGKVPTGPDGLYRARTTVPKDYSDHDHDPIGELFRAMGRHNRRAAHIHVKVWRGEECLLTTQIFIPGNPYLDSDYVEGAVSPDLTIDMKPAESGERNAYEAVFDIAIGSPKRR